MKLKTYRYKHSHLTEPNEADSGDVTRADPPITYICIAETKPDLATMKNCLRQPPRPKIQKTERRITTGKSPQIRCRSFS